MRQNKATTNSASKKHLYFSMFLFQCFSISFPFTIFMFANKIQAYSLSLCLQNRGNTIIQVYRLLPELKKTGYNTRARALNFVLPPKDNTNFLPRMLYIDIY